MAEFGRSVKKSHKADFFLDNWYRLWQIGGNFNLTKKENNHQKIITGRCSFVPVLFAVRLFCVAGAQSKKVGESTQRTSHVSVFIRHFLNKPAQNLGILRKLYQDFGLSSAQIETITDGAWQKETVIDALRANGIPRHGSNSFKTSYGQKRVYGFCVEVKKEQKVIEKILSLQKSGKSAEYVASTLNSDGIPSPKGGKWNPCTIRAILERETIILKPEEKPVQLLGG